MAIEANDLLDWRRFWQACKDVLATAEAWRAWAMKGLLWVGLAGVSFTAYMKPDQVLPGTILGRVLWLLSLLFALALGIQAAYRLRSKLEAFEDAKRLDREGRRLAIKRAFDSILVDIGRLRSSGSNGPYRKLAHSENSATESLVLDDLRASVISYRRAVASLKTAESDLHLPVVGQFQQALDGYGSRWKVLEALREPLDTLQRLVIGQQYYGDLIADDIDYRHRVFDLLFPASPADLPSSTEPD